MRVRHATKRRVAQIVELTDRDGEVAEELSAFVSWLELSFLRVSTCSASSLAFRFPWQAMF